MGAAVLFTIFTYIPLLVVSDDSTSDEDDEQATAVRPATSAVPMNTARRTLFEIVRAESRLMFASCVFMIGPCSGAGPRGPHAS
jgi:hypothetical protein